MNLTKWLAKSVQFHNTTFIACNVCTVVSWLSIGNLQYCRNVHAFLVAIFSCNQAKLVFPYLSPIHIYPNVIIIWSHWIQNFKGHTKSVLPNDQTNCMNIVLFPKGHTKSVLPNDQTNCMNIVLFPSKYS